VEMKTAFRALGRPDAAALLPQVKCPALVVHRRQVTFLKVDAARASAAKIPDARLTLLEGDSFQPYLGDTEAVLHAIDDFLGEAGSILREPALKEAAETFSDSGRLWSEIATAALPDSRPTLKKLRQLAIEKNELFERQPPHALVKMKKINLQFDELMKEAIRELRQKDPASLLAALQKKILRCYETEEKAFKKLNEIIK